MLEKLKKEVLNHKNKIAYIIGTEKITYGELWKESKTNSNLLKKQGSGPVIIYGHKDKDMIISILSCIMANRAYIPVDVCTPVERIKQIIKICSANIIIKTKELNIDCIECCYLNELTKFSNNQMINETNKIAYIIFTSGSTGEPKGVPISYDNLNNFINWISNIPPLNKFENIKILNKASFSFDLSVTDLFYSLCNGHTLVGLESVKDYNNIFEVINKNKVNLIVSTPTFMKMCLINKEFNEKNYPFINCMYFCGETLEKNTVKKIYESFNKMNIINAYGPTEATSAVSAIEIKKEMLREEELLPIGHTDTFATDITIEKDEIILKGKSVFNGYLNNYIGGYYKENNINCYKTGDIGYIKNNKLYIKGRKDNQIKYKGYRIELEDIENNIKKIDNVAECIVIAKYNEYNIVKNIIAYIVLKENKSLEKVKESLEEKIPQYMIPQFKLIDKMPINYNTKIDRKQLMKL